MSQRCLAVVGLQWGDEGKGKIIDWLSDGAKHVARFQGGNNAGHTVIVGTNKTVLHLIPSGILREHCHCYIGQGVVLDIEAFHKEVDMLRQAGVDVKGRILVSGGCSLVLPHHIALDKAREKGSGEIGTTKRGIGPAHEDKVGRRAVKLADVVDGNYQEKVLTSLKHANCELVHLHGAEVLDDKDVLSWVKEHGEKMKEYVADVPAELALAGNRGDNVLLEASQGALLDIEQGSYPYVTSASCISSAGASGLGIDLSPRVIGVAKAYTTRVGGGAFPTEMSGDIASAVAEKGEEFGSTTARKRRVGWFDVLAMRHALSVNGCVEIALTKLDVLSGVGQIKICVDYTIDGVKLASWPPSNSMLEQCEPNYIEMESWNGLPDSLHPDELPKECTAFINKLEELCDAEVSIVSLGPERSSTIWRGRHKQFA